MNGKRRKQLQKSFYLQKSIEIILGKDNKAKAKDNEAEAIAVTTIKYILRHVDNHKEVRRAIDLLNNVDWETIIKEKEQWLKRKYYLCDHCGEFFPIEDITTLMYGYESQNYCINPKTYCTGCIQKLVPEHSYHQCSLCSCLYLPGYKGHFAGVCHNCYTTLTNSEQKIATRVGHYILNNGGNLTFKEWLQTVEYFKGQCAYCLTTDYEVIEHFIPISLGGKTTVTNCVPSCKSCNTKKGNRNPQIDSMNDFIGIQQIRNFLDSLHTQN